MKAIYTLVSFLALCTLITAQKAPDFTITDYNGKVHKLYEDYLDQDKVVMIKIMFVACPPCNTAAPAVQDLYEEFGEGTEDVEFFDLSNKSWDTNSAVEGYSDKHNLTFPGAGANGGSLSAVDPYVSGMFGTFRGTPTFVVIDSDGDVNFNVSLTNLKAAIEDALNDDGGCTNAFNGVVSGVEAGEEVDVNLVSDVVGSQIYDLNPDGNREYAYECEFSFPPQALEYYIEVTKDGDDIVGVSTKDIVFVVRHLLGLNPFTDSKMKIAADFSANNVISARDVSEMRKLILGVTAENNNHNSWRFWSTATDFSHDTSGILIPDLIERVPLMDVVDSMTTANFHGVKLGDVSGDINDFFHGPNEPRSSQTLYFKDRYIQPGQTIEVPIFSKEDLAISGLQTSLLIDGSQKSLVSDLNLDLFTKEQSGIINALAYTPYEVQTSAEYPLLTVRFTSDRAGMISEMLSLSTEGTSSKILFNDNNEVPVTLEAILDDPKTTELFPNPTNGAFTILSPEMIESYRIYDVNGRQISSKEGIHSHQVSLDLTDHDPSVYWIQILTSEGASIHQLIKR